MKVQKAGTIFQKCRFCNAKPTLLPCKTTAFELPKRHFRLSFLFLLSLFMPYIPQQEAVFISHIYPQQHLNG
ncbi:hypothetical protein CTM62_05860 [Prevotella intermedia]|uniref:Uncharacterized protein n=1 Tax=Prevotella intermedia TaxID=28131 RepID=A0A2D3L6U9_PREIN|nr:hypothetical protein CTM62_05860 [Prevotella intermedia]